MRSTPPLQSISTPPVYLHPSSLSPPLQACGIRGSKRYNNASCQTEPEQVEEPEDELVGAEAESVDEGRWTGADRQALLTAICSRFRALFSKALYPAYFAICCCVFATAVSVPSLESPDIPAPLSPPPGGSPQTRKLSKSSSSTSVKTSSGKSKYKET